jgi:hypothetical protein
MVTQLSAAQLQFARHYFLYNESTDFYLHKLSIAEIADIIQCLKPTVLRLCQTALTQLGIPISGLAIHPTTEKRI